MKKIFLSGLIIYLFLGIVVRGVAAKTWPQPQGYVNDFAQLFSADFTQELESKLTDFESETSAEIAIATIISLEGDVIENAAVDIFSQWGIGKKDQDNGVLVLIAKDDRKIRIEVGYGLEPIITDAAAGRIIRDQMTPQFKAEDYEQGTLLAAEALMALIKNEPTEAAVVAETTADSLVPPAMFFLMLLFVYSAAFLGRTKTWHTGGIIGAFLGAVLGFMTASSLLFLLVVGYALVGLFLDWLFSKNYKALKKAGKSTSWRSSWGGFSSGRTSRTSSFGGFSGGSSGGGGASGGW